MQDGPTPAGKPDFPKVVRLKNGAFQLVGAAHGYDTITQEQMDALIESGFLIRWSDGSLWKDV